METILKYFPKLTEQQIKQFEMLGPLYADWNEKINVISRKDIENIYTHHVLHSLGIAAYYEFKPGAKILDLGSGGGFPGIPLAIFFPEAEFTLIDSIGKKMKVAGDIAAQIGLTNVQVVHGRAEELKTKYDYVVCRAVAELSLLRSWTRNLFSPKHIHGIPNGLIALKGGENLKEEIKAVGKGEFVESYSLRKVFADPYFEHKYCIYMQG